MSRSIEPIVAAGGVVVRDGRVLLVHRPELDDWTFPKGKYESTDFDLLACALREVWEESGYHCSPTGACVTSTYVMPNGRTKAVTLWPMGIVSGQFSVNNEVDEERWLPPDAAAEMLTYDSDRRALAQLVP